jgi:hypothetical protein
MCLMFTSHLGFHRLTTKSSNMGARLIPEQCGWSSIRKQADLLVVTTAFMLVVISDVKDCAVVEFQLQARG